MAAMIFPAQQREHQAQQQVLLHSALTTDIVNVAQDRDPATHNAD
jgi:hypothetical protein